MNIEKTVSVVIDDKTVLVADLPMPIRKQYEVLDAFRQRNLEDAVKYEMSAMAVNIKTLQLSELVRQHVNPPKPVPAEEVPPANE
jgi:hypothetical protein